MIGKRSIGVIVWGLGAVSVNAADMGTAFTFQGRLENPPGTLVTPPPPGTCNFRFGLWDAAVGGALVPPGAPATNPTTVSGLLVNRGFFIVKALEFGAGAIDGTARWLEIEVDCPTVATGRCCQADPSPQRNCNSSADCGGGPCGFCRQEPRVELKPAPHALALPGLYTQQNATSPNLIGGYKGNALRAGVVGGTIAGGGQSGAGNYVSDSFGAIGGGADNYAGNVDTNVNNAIHATVGGGKKNRALASYATIGGGGPESSGIFICVGGDVGEVYCGVCSGGSNPGVICASEANCLEGRCVNGGNQICQGGICTDFVANAVNDSYGTVGGGAANRVGYKDGSTTNQAYATVGGGLGNQALAHYATIGGGGPYIEFDPRTGEEIGRTPNRVTDGYGTIGGGGGNLVGNAIGTSDDAEGATVGGGTHNQATGSESTIGGGGSNSASGESSTVGGGVSNSARGESSTVGGGHDNLARHDYSTVGGGLGNDTNGSFSTVGGGFDNIVSDDYGSIGGGGGNRAGGSGPTPTDATYPTVAGGRENRAGAHYSSVGGGRTNIADGWYSTVAGGSSNQANGYASSVTGGQQCIAGGDFSFASGRRAKVRTAAQAGNTNGDAGSFVWGDSTDADFTSTGPNKFLVRASGGTRIYSNSAATVGVQLAAGGNSWSAISDRNVKENVTPVDSRDVLERLAGIPIGEWNLISQDASIRHIGPMAQDFHTAFGVGEVETHISGSDADGVALAAIQGLFEIVREKDCEVEELRSEISNLKEMVGKLAVQQNGGGR